MTTERQQAATGRLVEEYLDCKKKLADLQTEAQKVADSLTQVASNLRALGQMTAPAGEDVVSLITRQTGNFPTIDAVLSLARGIKEEMDRKQNLHSALTNIGLEPKD